MSTAHPDTNGEEPKAEPQRRVQRLLGRCILRVQQYERLTKAMLAEHELVGPVETLAGQRVNRVEKLADKSLGTLVKSLFETCVVPDGFERELLPEDRTPADRVSMAFSVRLSMTRETWTSAKAAIEELVAMRNDMVHHLIEQFDLWTEEGCAAAVCHLQQCYERIDRRYGELLEWARGMAAVREEAGAFLQTEAFRALLVDGIEPDASFQWPNTGIVRALREAAENLSTDGWARLDEARLYLAEKHPEQTPVKYHCRTWPQVLSESRQFDLTYRVADGLRVAWFRPRG